MSDEPSGIDRRTGIGVDDLPDLMRSVFDHCVQDAVGSVDPNEDFDTFLDALWANIEVAFNLTRQEWPDDLSRPWPVRLAEHRGAAEEVLEGRADSLESRNTRT